MLFPAVPIQMVDCRWRHLVTGRKTALKVIVMEGKYSEHHSSTFRALSNGKYHGSNVIVCFKNHPVLLCIAGVPIRIFLTCDCVAQKINFPSPPCVFLQIKNDAARNYFARTAAVSSPENSCNVLNFPSPPFQRWRCNRSGNFLHRPEFSIARIRAMDM